MLPNFLVIGAMKAGTTSLYEYLRAHPQVFMPEEKELDFFVRDVDPNKDLAWYERQFEGANGVMAVGEASTSYTKYPQVGGVPERIAQLLPKARLVYVIRHPIERMRSQYLHQALLGAESRPVEIAFASDPRYLDYSRYWMQISRYLRYFASEQVLVITAEALRETRRETLGRVYAFLGVDSSWWEEDLHAEHHRIVEKRVARPLLEPLHRNRMYRVVSRSIPEPVRAAVRPLTTKKIDPRKSVISDDLRRRLEDALRDDVAELRSYLGSTFDGWGLT